MKAPILLLALVSMTLSACAATDSERYVFFLHNRFVEDYALDEAHPQFGRAEYREIIAEFEQNGLTVLSEKRQPNTNAHTYATGIVSQIDSLTSLGVASNHITVVGTSKGGYIAQYVSTIANNPALNFVFIASYSHDDLLRMPDINYCGNILTIYERTDVYSASAIARKESSTCSITHFKEIELNTGLGHGFQFRMMQEWMQPTIRWAQGEHTLD